MLNEALLFHGITCESSKTLFFIELHEPLSWMIVFKFEALCSAGFVYCHDSNSAFKR